MSGRPEDSFWFDLTLRRDCGDPDDFTTVLGILPRFAREAGTKSRGFTSKSTVWIASLGEGRGHDEEFSDGLKAVMAILEKNHAFFHQFGANGGEALLTVNHTIAFDEGVLSDLIFEPIFLLPLAGLGIALKLRGWSSENWPVIEAKPNAFGNA